MNPLRIIIPLLCFILCGHTFAQAQDIDTELSNLTERLAGKIGAKDVKKVAVIDFTDLMGGSSELGKYIAEQMTVDLVMSNRVFSVLDRANLKRILAEHKLTASGLIDPDNCRKLGMFAGVDAIIIGTIIPKGDNISLTAKIITTETAEIVGADKSRFATDDTVKQLMSQGVAQGSTGGSSAGSSNDDTAKVVKSIGDLRVELHSLQVINGGRQYLLALTLVNQSPNRSIWVDLSPKRYGIVRDQNGYEFLMDDGSSTGIAAASVTRYTQISSSAILPPTQFFQATEIRPGESVSGTVKFSPERNEAASPGQCTVQLEILLGYDFRNGRGNCTPQNFAGKMTAE